MNRMDPPEDSLLDREMEALFRAAEAQTRTPAGFDQRLFARLGRERAHRTVAFEPAARETLPWWIRATAERHVALALVTAGLLLAWPHWWLDAAGAAREGVLSLLSTGSRELAGPAPSALAPLASARLGPVVAFLLAPALAWASNQLARAAERWTRRITLGRAA
jgi:hypothetical protein